MSIDAVLVGLVVLLLVALYLGRTVPEVTDFRLSCRRGRPRIERKEGR